MFALCIAVPCAWSAEPVPAFTLARLEALMLETSPAVRSVRDQARVAESAVTTARTFPNPSLDVMNGRMRPRDSDVLYGNTKGYSLTQPLDMPWNRFPRVDAAQAALQGALAEQRASLAELKARVRVGFFNVLRRQSEQRAAEEDRALTEDIRKRIALRLEVGEAAKFELIKADAEMLMAQKSASRLPRAPDKRVLNCAPSSAKRCPNRLNSQLSHKMSGSHSNSMSCATKSCRPTQICNACKRKADKTRSN